MVCMQKGKKGRTNSDINPVISIKCVAAPNQQAIYILVIFFFLDELY